MTKWPAKLIIVRHGESLFNREKDERREGRRKQYSERLRSMRPFDFPLTRQGTTQARQAGLWISQHIGIPNIVYTSPFLRTRETSQELHRAFPHVPLVEDERVREKEFGMMELISQDEFSSRFPQEFTRRQHEGKYYYRPPGGESIPDVNLRVHNFLSMLIREHAGETVVVVTHYMVILSFRKLLERWSEQEFLATDKASFISNASATLYTADDTTDKLTLVYFNKTIP